MDAATPNQESVSTEVMPTHPLVFHSSPDQVVAWRDGAPVTVRTFLADVARVAAALPAGGHVFNVCRGRVVRLTAIAHHARERGDVDDAPAPRADHRHEERLRHVEKAVERDVDHAAPLLARHAHERRVVVNARIVHENLHGRVLHELRERGFGGVGVGHVEGDGVRAAARRLDTPRDGLGRVEMPVSVHPDFVARLRERFANGLADCAAAACHECPHERFSS